MIEIPEKFAEMLKASGLGDLADNIREGQPEVSVRINKAKSDMIAEAPEFPKADGCVPWCSNGLYLSERPAFTLDPAFHQGRYYVQEASSMFHQYLVSQLTKGNSPVSLLDACAAPGGKTTAAIDVLPGGSVVVANEYIPARAATLRENAIKWGFPGIIVTRGDTAKLGKLRECFEIVIADVPCSGEGMMRKDPDAVAQWSEALIHECADRQWEIVCNLWDALRPGGYLIYSTCTFNRNENEDMVDRIINELGGESVEIPVEPEWGITPGIDTPHYCYRFIPGRVRGEGLFASVIKKDGVSSAPRLKSKPSKGDRKKSKIPVPPQVSRWLTDSTSMEIYTDADRITAFPAEHIQLLKAVKERVDVIHEGILLGNIKGKDVIPSQSLAMSQSLASEAFPRCELSLDDALHYLHGDAMTLPDEVEKGFVLLTYQNYPLGFVKNLGNRSNNLYPAGWRIRKTVGN